MSVIRVGNLSEQERFDQIWIKNWIEMGYELESYIIPGTEKYLFYNENSDFGSLELVPYSTDPAYTVNQQFPFNQVPELINSNVYEIDKLSVRSDSRGTIRPFMEILSFLISETYKKNLNYCVCFLNPDLYNTLVWGFKLPVKRITRFGFENLPYYPCIIDIHKSKTTKIGKRVLSKLKVSQPIGIGGSTNSHLSSCE